MKKLLFSFAISSVLLLIGCQENSITDPVSVEPVNKSQDLGGTTAIRGYFPLEGILVNPGNGFNSYLSIEGGISYIHEKVLLDPIPPAPQYNISIKLSVNAVLTDPDLVGRNSWTISGKSEDNIYVSEEGIYLLYKTFSVLGREDGLALVCRFLVTTDGIGLSEMLLVTPEDNTRQITGLNKSSEIKYPTVPPVTTDEFE